MRTASFFLFLILVGLVFSANECTFHPKSYGRDITPEEMWCVKLSDYKGYPGATAYLCPDALVVGMNNFKSCTSYKSDGDDWFECRGQTGEVAALVPGKIYCATSPDDNNQLLIKQLEADWKDCNSAVVLLASVPYTPIGAGTTKGSWNPQWIAKQDPTLWVDVAADNPELPAVSNTENLVGLTNKWIKNSGCSGSVDRPDLSVCLSRYCTDVVKVSLNKAGYIDPPDPIATFITKAGSVFESLFGNVGKLDKGSVHVKSIGTSGIILPNGAVVFYSEGVVNVGEDGSAQIYLINGKATYTHPVKEGVSYISISSGQKLSIDSKGEPVRVERFDAKALDQWWNSMCPGIFFLIGFALFGAMFYRVQ